MKVSDGGIMIQETSLLAWAKTQEKLSAKQMCVWNLLKSCKFPVTNSEIAKLLGWSINRLTPRIFELRKHGLVVNAGRRKCHVTHNMVMVWQEYDGVR